MSSAVRVAPLVVPMLVLAACPVDGGEAGEVPDGWSEVQTGDLVYAVPEGFEEPTDAPDPQAVSEHVRGDADDLSSYEWIGLFRSSAESTTGDEVTLARYVDELCIVGGGLAGRYEDLEVSDREQFAVAGAVEAERLTVTYFEPDADEDVVQTVVLVRSDEHIYDLRYIATATGRDGDVAGTLPDTVALR